MLWLSDATTASLLLVLTIILQNKNSANAQLLSTAATSTNGAGINIGHRTCPPQCKCDIQQLNYAKTVRCNDAPALSDIDFKLIDVDVGTIEIVHARQLSGVGGASHTGYLPPNFSRFPLLRRLLIRRGAIHSIPLETVAQLQGIRTLDLRLNQIRSLEPLNLERMPQIELLDLSDNNIEEIKTLPLGYLRYLQVLGLGGNEIHSIEAPALNNKPMLFYVSMADNKLSYLPDDAFDGLLRLEILDLSNNQFTTLPKGIEKLKFLQELRLDSNLLTTLTTNDLQRIDTLASTLKQVTLHGNPLYCDVRIAALLQFMRTTQTGRARFCRTTAPQCPECFSPVKFHKRQISDVSLVDLGVETGTAAPPIAAVAPMPTPATPAWMVTTPTPTWMVTTPTPTTMTGLVASSAITPSSLAAIFIANPFLTTATATPTPTTPPTPAPLSGYVCPCPTPAPVVPSAAATSSLSSSSFPENFLTSAAGTGGGVLPWYDVSRTNAIDAALSLLGLRPQSAIVSLEAVAAPLQSNEMRPKDLVCMRLPGARCSNETNACYLFAGATSATESWNQARFACQLFGFDLLTFDDEKEHTTVNTLLKDVIAEDVTRRSPSRGWWIGLRRAVAGGPFLTVDRVLESTVAKWGASQPNNFAGDENCVEMWDTGEWNDIKCEANIKNFFICKKRRPPLPPTTTATSAAAPFGPQLPPGGKRR